MGMLRTWWGLGTDREPLLPKYLADRLLRPKKLSVSPRLLWNSFPVARGSHCSLAELQLDSCISRLQEVQTCHLQCNAEQQGGLFLYMVEGPPRNLDQATSGIKHFGALLQTLLAAFAAPVFTRCPGMVCLSGVGLRSGSVAPLFVGASPNNGPAGASARSGCSTECL